jgi:hypothetical protein
LSVKYDYVVESRLSNIFLTPQRAWSRGAQFRKLVSEPALGGQVARQLIQCGRLGQFSLASRLLYSDRAHGSSNKPQAISKQRRAQERSIRRVSGVFVHERFP